VQEILDRFGDLIDGNTRRVFVSDPTSGKTLEPQILAANPDDALMRRILRLTGRANLGTWMKDNKTEAALRIASADEVLCAPTYIRDAIGFIGGHNK
jgi:hypothetical protein